jgi:hypothetical protein
MQDYSKILKVIQYFCVITSEYDLYNYHLRGLGLRPCIEGLVGGPKLNENQ